MTNAHIEGIDKTEILDANYDETTKQFKFKFILPLSINMNYTFWSHSNTEHLTGNFTNNGSFHWAATDKAEFEISFYFNNDEKHLFAEKLELSFPEALQVKLDKYLPKKLKERVLTFYTNRLTSMLDSFNTVDEVTDWFSKNGAKLRFIC